jgi:hypothetical protein
MNPKSPELLLLFRAGKSLTELRTCAEGHWSEDEVDNTNPTTFPVYGLRCLGQLEDCLRQFANQLGDNSVADAAHRLSNVTRRAVTFYKGAFVAPSHDDLIRDWPEAWALEPEECFRRHLCLLADSPLNGTHWQDVDNTAEAFQSSLAGVGTKTIVAETALRVVRLSAGNKHQ